MEGGDFKEIKLKYNLQTSSFYLVNNQSKSDIDLIIRTAFGCDPSVYCLGIIEQSDQDQDVGPLIPLDLLAQANATSVLKKGVNYRPQFHFGTQLSSLPPPIDTSYNNNETQATTQASGSSGQTYDASDPWQNWEYFYQYGKLGIHTEMLKDESRTNAYRDAIFAHAADIKDKVVMDLGCGTGILSYFCVKAGAKKVYAVEASSLAEWTELVVASNGLSDKIEVVRGRVEELHFSEKVDVIVSEWMGTFLIFESMLESLLFARDHWLKPEGILLPSHANIFLSTVCMDELFAEKVTFWNKVYDVDMSVMIPFAKKCAFEKPIIDKVVKPEWVLSDAAVIKSFDLRTVPIDEPYNKTIVKFDFKVKKSGNFHGFAAWFDVIFKGKSSKNEVVLSTSPDHKDTHWHQDLFLFDNPIEVLEGQTIRGTIRYQRNPDLLRHLIIDITFSVDETGIAHSKKFFLWGNE